MAIRTRCRVHRSPLQRGIGKRGFDQVAHPFPVLGGNRVRRTEPHFVEFERRE